MSFPQFRSLYYYYCPLFYDILIKVKGETTVKFICQSSVLRSEIELANSFSSSKNSLSISSNVLLEAGNDALSIKATDQKMGFSSAISVSVQIPGETTVYCEKLSQLLKNIPEVMEIDITTGSTPISIRLCAADIMNLEEILYEKIQMTSEMIIHNCRTFVPYYRK